MFIHGKSLGGAVAIYMADQNPNLFRGLIVENTFTSISAMADALYWPLKPVKSLILKIGWNSD
jgi:alpha-beta hydrolase superfamily lysophospholipase